jgi:hypothetical protein
MENTIATMDAIPGKKDQVFYKLLHAEQLREENLAEEGFKGSEIARKRLINLRKTLEEN